MMELRTLSEYLKPTAHYSTLCDSVVEELYQLLRTNSVFPVSHCVLGGGLPSAKNTSTCLKADADMTVYVTWPCSLNITWIPLKKELVLDDWWRVIFKNTVPDNPDDVVQRTANSLHFYYRKIPVDILVGFQFNIKKEKQRYTVMTILRVAHRLVSTNYRLTSMNKLIKCLGSEPNDAGVDWMRRKSAFVCDIARLAKFWSQTVLYNGCGNGKSFFIELVAVKSALEEEGLSSSDHKEAFKRFLSNMVGLENLRIIFLDLYCRGEIPNIIADQVPLILNPSNPFQNIFECVDDEYKTIMTEAAQVTLDKLNCGSEDIVNIFYPQNYSTLNLLINMKDHCWSCLDSDINGIDVPTVTMSEWLRPILNWSKEKIVKDWYRETRYLIMRIQRLFASVVFTTEMSMEEHSVTSIVQNLQDFCNNISKSVVRLEKLEALAMTRDVVFRFPCRRKNVNIYLGVNIHLPYSPD